MLIGVLSDTHDRLPMIDAAIACFRREGVAVLIHPGDFVAPFALKRVLTFGGPVYATFGNNDGERRGLREVHPTLADGPLFIELDGTAILVHHYLDWCKADWVARARIIVTGHTHEPVARTEDGRLFVNPGECCGWVTERCTVAVLDTAGPSARIIELEAV
ncbi:MAG TPA: metallophosphoesterase [Phycisphaerae bacterium]|nr:metallophosphoesterase [Phycisphaerae bacterium]HNU44371.1 metallophosphoesterase [Phycisphaerae bacterium]